MKLINILCTTTFLIFAVIAAPVQAKLLDNSWYPFEFVLEEDPENPCGDDPFYLAQGMQHIKVSTLRRGGVAFSFNALGTFTGLVTGQEAHWRHNVTDVLPIDGENVVHTFRDNLKLIGQGGDPSYFATIKFHVTVIGGEVKSYIDSAEIKCG